MSTFGWISSPIRNLELLGSSYDGDQGQSLLKVLDNTVSPMGARLLKRWLLMPLKDRRPIEQRLDSVEHLHQRPRSAAPPLPNASANAVMSKGWLPGSRCAKPAPAN